MGVYRPPAPSGTDPADEYEVRRQLMVGMPIFATTLEEDITFRLGSTPGDGIHEAQMTAIQRDLPNLLANYPTAGQGVRAYDEWTVTFVDGFGANDPNRYLFSVASQPAIVDPLDPTFGWPSPQGPLVIYPPL